MNERQKRAIIARINEAKKLYASALLSYDGLKLKARLAQVGISEGDTLLVHSNFKPDSGFKGTPLDVVNVLADVIGPQGNLLMVSIPFRGAACDYLLLNKTFNAQKTVSMMGLVTEMFRRRPGTLRSLHPTHPVLAWGKDAEWLVADHENCIYPCGPGSPFDKFRQLNGKILFFDVRFGAITFFHYVEDAIKERLPFSVYDERLFSATVIDGNGQKRCVKTYAFNKAIPRSAKKLELEMRRQGMLKTGRVGNSRFMLVTAADVIACQTAMVRAGNFPYDLSRESPLPDENYD